MTNTLTRFLISLLWLWFVSVAQGQDNVMISAEGVEFFQSVQHIDYAELDADIDIGWFVTNDTATELMVFDNDGVLYTMSDDGEILSKQTYIENADDQIFSVIDGTYAFDTFYILYTLDGTYWLNDSEIKLEGIPLAIGHDDDFLYIESDIEGELIVYQMDSSLEVTDQFTIPADSDAPVMRVGRIGLPMIVQSSFEGQVTIFDYDRIVGDYQIEMPPAVFGSLSKQATYFAWVDPNSTYLNLLDLDSGDNQVVSELNNRYAQYYLLSHDGSLAIAINVDFTPNVIAWDTSTGQHYDLGEYRECERIPDRVRLSVDGSTLVIGCDTGLDLWRIVGEKEDN